MKSRLFSNFDPASETGRAISRDLKVLIRLYENGKGKDKVEACMDRIPEIAETMTSRQVVVIAENLARDREGMSRGDVIPSLQILRHLTERLTDEEAECDSSSDLADDLVEVGILEDARKRYFVDIIDDIRTKILPKYKKIKRKKQFSSGVLPSLKSFGTTVELRAVLENDFRIGMSSIEYDPGIYDFIPVISIILRTDSGIPDTFTFQASKEETIALIEELRAAVKCAEQIELFADEARVRLSEREC